MHEVEQLQSVMRAYETWSEKGCDCYQIDAVDGMSVRLTEHAGKHGWEVKWAGREAPESGGQFGTRRDAAEDLLRVLHARQAELIDAYTGETTASVNQ